MGAENMFGIVIMVVIGLLVFSYIQDRNADDTPLPDCVPDCSDVPTICEGQQFGDGCGGSCQGTKDCSTCTDTSWNPARDTVCSGQLFQQTSNCGNIRSTTGTKDCSTCTDSSWLPDRSTVCSGVYMVQTSNCDRTRSTTGTKYCSVPSGDHVFKLMGAFYASSSLDSGQVQFLNENLDLGIFHEYIFPSLGSATFIKYLYKHSGLTSDSEFVGPCCYDWVAANHDDWFLHCGAGKCADVNSPHKYTYWMNYKKFDWLDWSAADINQDAAHWNADGVFYDAIQNLRAEMNFPNEYSSDIEVRDSLYAMLSYMRNKINKPFVANAAIYVTGGQEFPEGPEAQGKAMMDRCDGINDESLGISWGGGWYSAEIIEVQLNVMEYAEQQRKVMMIEALLKHVSASEFDDVVALYMLGASDYSYFGFNYEGYNYGSFKKWVLGNQDLINAARSLGKPLARRTKSGSTLTRQFENGYVTFNLDTKQGRIVVQ